jgi:hypothetical protein
MYFYIPDRAREYLEQAISSISAPAGAIMLAASSVDAMLKEKGLNSGKLYSRINLLQCKGFLPLNMR